MKLIEYGNSSGITSYKGNPSIKDKANLIFINLIQEVVDRNRKAHTPSEGITQNDVVKVFYTHQLSSFLHLQ